jgi:phytoene dehydrogenase-like protein
VTERYDAVVVGSGPNGLGAAIELARHDLSVLVIEGSPVIGGGARTAELTVPGYRHDVCSSVHPFAAVSPFLSGLPLDEHGLTWLTPEVAVAHPFAGERGAMIAGTIEETTAAMGADAEAYRGLMTWPVDHAGLLIDTILEPLLRIPRSPHKLVRLGLLAPVPMTRLARRFTTPEVRGLFAGLAGHTVMPLSRPLTGAMAVVMAMIAHHRGWPVASGGSSAIIDAMAAHLRSLGGEIVTGWWVDSLDELPEAKAVVLDVAPAGLVRIAADRLPPRFIRRMEKWKYGPAVFKVDLALDGPIPWDYEPARRAGTVHLGGTLEEIAAGERAAWEGRADPNPYVILTQPSVIDPGRAPAGGHSAWAYAHVPQGHAGDSAEPILRQIERYAPGFRDAVVATHVAPPAHLEMYNPNNVAGTIAGGALTVGQTIGRPTWSLDPYTLPADGLYLCSAATPPGAGTHAMSGYHAATAALRRSFA